eukprot:gb/GECG01016392.1/.p1 GENE.gb/GECG01016392.1/~~gb/GECG01016392.1/.p1  ORF type:complete len:315 (+),score=34.88 gb/GECG01016392.1/:1-945(+)
MSSRPQLEIGANSGQRQGSASVHRPRRQSNQGWYPRGGGQGGTSQQTGMTSPIHISACSIVGAEGNPGSGRSDRPTQHQQTPSSSSRRQRQGHHGKGPSLNSSRKVGNTGAVTSGAKVRVASGGGGGGGQRGTTTNKNAATGEEQVHSNGLTLRQSHQGIRNFAAQNGTLPPLRSGSGPKSGGSYSSSFRKGRAELGNANGKAATAFEGSFSPVRSGTSENETQVDLTVQSLAAFSEPRQGGSNEPHAIVDSNTGTILLLLLHQSLVCLLILCYYSNSRTTFFRQWSPTTRNSQCWSDTGTSQNGESGGVVSRC